MKLRETAKKSHENGSPFSADGHAAGIVVHCPGIMRLVAASLIAFLHPSLHPRQRQSSRP